MIAPDAVGSPLEGSPMSRSTALRRSIALAFSMLVARAGVRPRGRHQRAGRARHPRGRPLPQVPAAARRLLDRGRGPGQDRDDEPGDAGPAHRGRARRIAYDPERPRTTCEASARSSSATPTASASRPWSSPPPSPERDRLRLLANVDWLEQAQLKPGDRVPWPGTWTYSENKGQAGDHSNTQYALLGLNAASEAGIVVKPAVWALSRDHFERFQNRDGGWAYTPRHNPSTGSMTCAGISSLIIAGSRRYEGLEFLQGEAIRDCGRGARQSPATSRDRLARRPLPGRREHRPRPGLEVLLSLRDGAGRPARRRPVLRPERLVSPGRRGAGPRPAPALGILARGGPGERAGRDELRAAVPRQGPRTGADQQAAPHALPATGTTIPTTCATSSDRSPATGRAC